MDLTIIFIDQQVSPCALSIVIRNLTTPAAVPPKIKGRDKHEKGMTVSTKPSNAHFLSDYLIRLPHH